MPIVRFVCPHCEKPAEVQVTGVTRSRPCPHCGENVVLQVAFLTKDTGLSKRPALLVNSVSDAPPREPMPAPKVRPPVPVAVQRSQAEVGAPPGNEDEEAQLEDGAAPGKRPLPVMRGPAYEPKELGGTVVERMRLDPEVRQLKIRLALGAAAVVAALAFVFAGLTPQASQPEDLTRRDAEQMLGGGEVVKRLKSKNAVVLMRGLADKPLTDEPPKSVPELHPGDAAVPRDAAEETSAVIEEQVSSRLTGS